MRTIQRLGQLAGTCLATFALAGCSDNDGNGPAAPSSNSEEQAQAQALSIVDFVDVIIGDVDELAAGNLVAASRSFRWEGRLVEAEPDHGLRSEATPVWDPAEQAWVYVSSYSDANGSVTIAYRIQFVDDEGKPQHDPDTTTAQIHYTTGMEIHADGTDEESGRPIHVDFTYGQQLQIADLQTSTWSITGGGTMTGVVSDDTDRNDWQYETTMEWGVNVTVPSGGGCPSGTIGVGVDGWTLVATYDAANQTYGWAMLAGGSDTPIASGYGTSACSADVVQAKRQRAFEGR